MRRAAEWAESVVDCHTLERVREAMGASVVKSRDRVRVATGFGGWCLNWRHPWRLVPLGGWDVIGREWDGRSGE